MREYKIKKRKNRGSHEVEIWEPSGKKSRIFKNKKEALIYAYNHMSPK